MKDKMDMVVHQTKADDSQYVLLPYGGKAKGNAVHSGNEFPRILKQNRLFQPFGGTVKIVWV